MADVTRVQILSVRRLSNSPDGNPQYRISTKEDGKLTTAKNAGFVYGLVWDRIGDPAGDPWTVKIGPRGTIIDMWK